MTAQATARLQNDFEEADQLLADLRALGSERLRPGFVHYRPHSNSWGISLGRNGLAGEGLYADLQTLRTLHGRVRGSDADADRKIKALVQEALSQMDRWGSYVDSDEYKPPKRQR